MAVDKMEFTIEAQDKATETLDMLMESLKALALATKSFKDFSSFSQGGVTWFAKNEGDIRKFISGLKLTEKQMDKLEDTFKKTSDSVKIVADEIAKFERGESEVKELDKSLGIVMMNVIGLGQAIGKNFNDEMRIAGETATQVSKDANKHFKTLINTFIDGFKGISDRTDGFRLILSEAQAASIQWHISQKDRFLNLADGIKLTTQQAQHLVRQIKEVEEAIDKINFGTLKYQAKGAGSKGLAIRKLAGEWVSTLSFFGRGHKDDIFRESLKASKDYSRKALQGATSEEDKLNEAKREQAKIQKELNKAKRETEKAQERVNEKEQESVDLKKVAAQLQKEVAEAVAQTAKAAGDAGDGAEEFGDALKYNLNNVKTIEDALQQLLRVARDYNRELRTAMPGLSDRHKYDTARKLKELGPALEDAIGSEDLVKILTLTDVLAGELRVIRDVQRQINIDVKKHADAEKEVVDAQKQREQAARNIQRIENEIAQRQKKQASEYNRALREKDSQEKAAALERRKMDEELHKQRRANAEQERKIAAQTQKEIEGYLKQQVENERTRERLLAANMKARADEAERYNRARLEGAMNVQKIEEAINARQKMFTDDFQKALGARDRQDAAEMKEQMEMEKEWQKMKDASSKERLANERQLAKEIEQYNKEQADNARIREKGLISNLKRRIALIREANELERKFAEDYNKALKERVALEKQAADIYNKALRESDAIDKQKADDFKRAMDEKTKQDDLAEKEYDHEITQIERWKNKKIQSINDIHKEAIQEIEDRYASEVAHEQRSSNRLAKRHAESKDYWNRQFRFKKEDQEKAEKAALEEFENKRALLEKERQIEIRNIKEAKEARIKAIREARAAAGGDGDPNRLRQRLAAVGSGVDVQSIGERLRIMQEEEARSEIAKTYNQRLENVGKIHAREIDNINKETDAKIAAERAVLEELIRNNERNYRESVAGVNAVEDIEHQTQRKLHQQKLAYIEEQKQKEIDLINKGLKYELDKLNRLEVEKHNELQRQRALEAAADDIESARRDAERHHISERERLEKEAIDAAAKRRERVQEEERTRLQRLRDELQDFAKNQYMSLLRPGAEAEATERFKELGIEGLMVVAEAAERAEEAVKKNNRAIERAKGSSLAASKGLSSLVKQLSLINVQYFTYTNILHDLEFGLERAFRIIRRVNKELITGAGEFEKYKRTVLVTEGGEESGLERYNDLVEMSVDLVGASTQSLIKYNSMFRAAGVSIKDTNVILQGITKSMAELGKGTYEVERILRQLTQAISGNKLVLQDIRPILEELPQFWQAVTGTFGVGIRDIETFRNHLDAIGMDYSEGLIKVMRTVNDLAIGADLNTYNAAMEQLTDQFQVLVAEIGEQALPTIKLLLGALKGLVDWFRALPKWTKWLIAHMFLLSNVIGILYGAVKLLTGGIIAYHVVIGSKAVLEYISTLQKQTIATRILTILTAGLGASAKSTLLVFGKFAIVAGALVAAFSLINNAMADANKNSQTIKESYKELNSVVQDINRNVLNEAFLKAALESMSELETRVTAAGEEYNLTSQNILKRVREERKFIEDITSLEEERIRRAVKWKKEELAHRRKTQDFLEKEVVKLHERGEISTAEAERRLASIRISRKELQTQNNMLKGALAYYLQQKDIVDTEEERVKLNERLVRVRHSVSAFSKRLGEDIDNFKEIVNLTDLYIRNLKEERDIKIKMLDKNHEDYVANKLDLELSYYQKILDAEKDSRDKQMEIFRDGVDVMKGINSDLEKDMRASLKRVSDSIRNRNKGVLTGIKNDMEEVKEEYKKLVKEMDDARILYGKETPLMDALGINEEQSRILQNVGAGWRDMVIDFVNSIKALDIGGELGITEQIDEMFAKMYAGEISSAQFSKSIKELLETFDDDTIKEFVASFKDIEEGQKKLSLFLHNEGVDQVRRAQVYWTIRDIIRETLKQTLADYKENIDERVKVVSEGVDKIGKIESRQFEIDADIAQKAQDFNDAFREHQYAAEGEFYEWQRNEREKALKQSEKDAKALEKIYERIARNFARGLVNTLFDATSLSDFVKRFIKASLKMILQHYIETEIKISNERRYRAEVQKTQAIQARSAINPLGSLTEGLGIKSSMVKDTLLGGGIAMAGSSLLFPNEMKNLTSGMSASAVQGAKFLESIPDRLFGVFDNPYNDKYAMVSGANKAIERAATRSAKDQMSYFNTGFDKQMDMMQNNTIKDPGYSAPVKIENHITLELNGEPIARLFEEVDAMIEEGRINLRNIGN